MTKALSPKQRRFVDEYLIVLNGNTAAIRAGYSRRSAYSIAHENLIKPEVRAAIAAAQYSRELLTNITKARIESPRVLRRLQFLREWSHEQEQQVFPRST